MTRPLVRYVGGTLELTPDLLARPVIGDAATQLGLAPSRVMWTGSGRGALAAVLHQWRDQLSGGCLLAPDYLCWDALSPVLDEFNVRYLPIGDDLTLEPAALERHLADETARAVLLLDYFGLCDLEPQIDSIRRRRPDVLILVDAAQGFVGLTHTRYAGADAIVSSPRKMLPLADGGLAIMDSFSGIAALTRGADQGRRSALFLASGVLRSAVISGSFDQPAREIAESVYLEWLREHSDLVATRPEAMSALSAELLTRTDLHEVARRRTANVTWWHQAVQQGRGAGLLQAALPAGRGPGLAFPVRVPAAQRQALRAFLRDEGFFCPVHWPVPVGAKLGPIATALSSTLLSLPVDQRYGPEDLERLLNAIERYHAHS